MLGDFKVGRCSRKCFSEDRPLQEGEAFYSVVIENPSGFERRDYSAGSWQGPPEGAVGHWKNRMPESGERKLVLAPREVLIDLLRQMESAEIETPAAKLRYLLALLLLRRRMVRLATAASTIAEEEGDEAKWMQIETPNDGSIIRIAECRISKSETESLTASLNELLYCEAGAGEDDDETAGSRSTETDNG
ncbi:MAG: hypothetical protein AAFU85_29190 [Planctomycetota bacterium]